MTLCELLHQVAWIFAPISNDICRNAPKRNSPITKGSSSWFEKRLRIAPPTYPACPLHFGSTEIPIRSPVNGTIWLMIRLTILVVTSPIMPSVARCRVRWPHGSKNSRYPSTNPSGPPFAFGSCCATMERMTTATRPK